MSFQQLRLAFFAAMALTIVMVAVAQVYSHRVIETPEHRAQREAIVAAGRTVCPDSKQLVIDFTEKPYAIRCL